jgi:hypothetical protein
MRIIVDHLTRMQRGYICVAGYEPSTFQHIRPVLGRRLRRSLLRVEGGPFDLGLEVDVGAVTNVGSPPEVEDHEFREAAVRAIGQVGDAAFWSDLESMAYPDLQSAFGDDLERHGNGYAVSVGRGEASLACLALENKPTLEVSAYGKLRCRFEHEDGLIDLSVTDIRLCESDHKTIRENLVQQIGRRILEGSEVILTMGLARPWRKPGDTRKRHWLQVNNVFLQDDPYLAGLA